MENTPKQHQANLDQKKHQPILLKIGSIFLKMESPKKHQPILLKIGSILFKNGKPKD